MCGDMRYVCNVVCQIMKDDEVQQRIHFLIKVHGVMLPHSCMLVCL